MSFLSRATVAAVQPAVSQMGISHFVGRRSNLLRRQIARCASSEATTQVWSAEITPVLSSVENTVNAALDNTQKAFGDSESWIAAFTAVREIANSPHRHMLRPQLLMLGYATGKNGDLQSVSHPDVINFAAAVELHHLFMLILDDNMDNGTIRRGVPTVNSVLNQVAGQRKQSAKLQDTVHLTTIIANVLLALSSELTRLPDSPNSCTKQLRGWNEAGRIMDEATLRAGSAQFADVVGWDALQTGDKGGAKIRKLLMDKSGYHTFEAPLLMGLALSGSKDLCLIESAKLWSRSIGVAFQGLDDVLDIMGDPLDSGKDSLQDVQEGRISLPLYLLKTQATDEEWDFVMSLNHGAGTYSPLLQSERARMFKLCEKYKLVQQTLDFVELELGVSNGVLDGCLLDSVQQCAESHEFMSHGLSSVAEGLSLRLEQVRKASS